MTDDIDKLIAAREVLEKIDTSDKAAMHFALVHAVRALRFAKDADGLTPTRRQQVRSAYRMCSAAAGMDHE